jgi:SAM-dependent methyltransferase
MTDNMDVYFSGRKLYGDDFTAEQLEKWYEEEREGYAGEVAAKNIEYTYNYHELNKIKLYGNVKIEQGARALGIGSAYGNEFFPILDRLGHLTIIDPSDEFSSHTALQGTPVVYRKPTLDGTMDFPNGHFDLITAFGALHHIANVSNVIAECYRCLRPGGHMLIREPIVTQGDWRQRRGALTKNERGIPIALMKGIVTGCGFTIEKSSLFDFAPFTRAMHQLGVPAFTNPITTHIDHFLSLLFSFNTKYHRTTFFEKFGPASLSLVLRKPN